MRRIVPALLVMVFTLGLVSQSEAQSGPYSQVVDNASKNRFAAADGWRVSTNGSGYYGKNYAVARTAKKPLAARFKVRIPKTGPYTVYARWPARNNHNNSTRIGVRAASGVKWTRVNQQRNGGRWVKIGRYRLEKGDRYTVMVSRRTDGKRLVVADAVKVVESRRSVRKPDSILGPPIHSQASVKKYARSVGSTRYIMETIPHYYKLAPRAGIAPDVLVAQAILETGRGHYGGDSKPWNMAGIKKGGVVGDSPRDFERPRTAYEGVRMHVNHMAAYTGKKPIGKPHDRFRDARAAQKNRGWWVRRVSQLGGGVWAMDSTYAGKIRRILNDMGKH